MKNIDFIEKGNVLMKEAFSFSRYKKMNIALAIITAIFNIPFMLMFLAVMVVYYLCAFLFNVLEAPIKYLHSLVRSEGEVVKHGTQVIIYWVSWPIIFIFYVAVAFLTIFLHIYYAIASILAYIWTLGSFKFNVLISKEIETKPYQSKMFVKPLVFSICHASIFVALAISAISVYSNLYRYYLEKMFNVYFLPAFLTFVWVGLLFTALYDLIAYNVRAWNK